MDLETCDYFEPIGRKDKMCKYFIGEVNKKYQVDRCNMYCSILVSKALMEEGQVLERKNGRLRRR